MNILCIETATTVCSVCVADESGVLAMRELNSGYTHAENLHVFVEDVMKEAGITFKELSAVAVSKGPGSYTGLRIGVSAAKGFCYSLNIPLISVDTLKAMASAVAGEIIDGTLCPMLDARRMEVYCAMYNKELEAVLPVQALVLDENSVQMFNTGKPVYFFGEGMPKSRSLLATIPGAMFIEDKVPSAASLVKLAIDKFNSKNFENTAHFEPFYLKEFFTK